MPRKRWARRALMVLAAALPLFVFAGGAVTASAEDEPPLPVPHQVFNGVVGIGADSTSGTVGESTYKNPPSPICTTSGANTDCEGVAPHNETSIAVNPTNGSNIIGGANDYQLRLSSGGTVVETIYSRAHVTFDGGQTWAMYPIDFNGYAATGDPAIAFDATGRAYYATLGFTWSQNRGCCINPDILVSTSANGGRSWSTPARVASGTGSFGSPGTFNDKEFVTAWGNGNAIVTWTVFNDGIGGSYISSPIYASVTHDGGQTWSRGVEISGSAAFCAGSGGGTACNQNQGSTPVVAADGSIYVSFVNYSNDAAGRDQYLVVKVNPATGARIGGPYRVGGIVDGFTDYPINIDGRQTYQDSQFRSWSVGNMAADPTNAQHLAVVWSDMRNSPLPANRDPYQATTNSDVIVSQSFDGGATWSTPAALALRNDQFQPWSTYDSTGKLRIGFFDRSYDAANHRYGYTLATERRAGSLTFATTQLSTALSDPTQGDRWFSGRTPNPAFPHPTTFLGDYSGIAPTASGGVVALWTDLSVQNVCFPARCGTGEDAFFGAR
jgi:hypothetical protein